MAHPLALSAQKAVTPEAMPKLVIGIAVDQLRTDYLYALQSRFGEDGFRRLLSEGVVYESVTFDLDQPDATATLAVLASGSYPFVSGICATRAYNPQTLREQSIFYDKKYLGNFTQDNYSPAALIGTTVGDELKTATNGAAKVYSIAPEAEAALLGAGHRGNAAFWIDNKSGKWALRGADQSGAAALVAFERGRDDATGHPALQVHADGQVRPPVPALPPALLSLL
jgi:hypothetical protein